MDNLIARVATAANITPEIARKAVAFADQAAGLRHRRQGQQQENRDCLKIYRAMHSCP